MENKALTPKVPTRIHFIPYGPIDSAARKAIRSHVTLDIRRKQRQQKLLNLQAKHSKPKDAFLEESLCRCYAFAPSVQDCQPENKISKSKTAIQRQQAADSYKFCPKCRGVQFSALSEQGKLRSTKGYPSVMALLQSGLDPFEASPKVPNLPSIGNQLINEIKAHFITFMSPGLLKTTLVPAANQSSALLMGVLYLSCLNLSAMRDDQDERLVSLGKLIKKEALHQINKLLLDPKTAYTTETISAIGWLSAGVWCLGEATALEEVNAHEKGLSSLVHLGPTWEPGKDEPLARSLVKLLVLHEYLRSAMTDAPLDEYIQLKYQKCPTISKSDVFAESPLFCPLSDFYNVRNAKGGNERTIKLLQATKRLVDSTLELDPMLGDARKLHVQGYELAKAQLDEILLAKDGDSMQVDYVYESCRLAALLMAQAIDTGTPFSELGNSLADQLKHAMQKTDIGNVWGQMSGVLWWVCLVGDSVATIGAPQHRYIDTVLRQTMHELIYKSPLFEAATIATAKFARIKALIGIPRKIREEAHQ